jgi:hydroxymethylpyrimidine pyrophosphatase-like HAD family hydrolase
LIIIDIDDTLLKRDGTPIQHVIDYVNSIYDTKIIVTGRNSSERSKTIYQLHHARVNYDRLVMNPGSYKESHKFKEHIAQEFGFATTLAIENNSSARAAYEKFGIKTLDPALIPEEWDMPD